MSGLLFKLIIFLVLFGIGWWFGRINESRHLRSLDEREAQLRHIRVLTHRFDTRPNDGQLVTASVMIAQDYFKWAWAQVHNFFGGRLRTYEMLLDRARREATIRLKQHAAQHGATEILGLRLEVSEIGAERGMVEVLAYGTMIFAGTQAGAWPPQPTATLGAS